MDQIGNLLDRPRLYGNIDGLAELGGGILCLGFALILRLVRLPGDSVWHRISLLVVAGLVLFIHYGTKAVKTRITYPRTGFVEYRKRWHTSAIAGAMGGLVCAGLAVGFRRHWDISMLAPLAGLAFAASYGYQLATAVRWKWVAAGAIAAAALAIAFLPADVPGALGGRLLLSLLVWGTILLISGGISFWLYLRHTPAPAQEGQ